MGSSASKLDKEETKSSDETDKVEEAKVKSKEETSASSAAATVDVPPKISDVELIDEGDYYIVPSDLDPSADDVTTVMCISDTHGLHSEIPEKWALPKVDLLIHAGDFTNVGELTDIESYADFVDSLKKAGVCQRAILVAGNHDITLEPKYYEEIGYDRFHAGRSGSRGTRCDTDACIRAAMRSGTYLEDSGVTVCGVTVYGSPWQPEFCDWAFNLERGKELAEKWAMIPEDGAVDVLVTHSPPRGHGDRCRSGFRAGCDDLLASVVTKVRPQFHVFGHIHEGYGVTKQEGLDTYFINASTVTSTYRVEHKPIVFYIRKTAATTSSSD